jgi:signal recognition particle subunit SRP54
MFENLTERLGQTLKQIRGQARLSEDNISEAIRDVRRALLEADVALPVVQAFTEQVKKQALGQQVAQSLSPEQAFIKVVQKELIEVMGEASPISLNVPAPAVILMAGLQGAGKTTTVAKLARHLQTVEKKKVLLTSCDVYRPAAIEQLGVLAKEVDAGFFEGSSGLLGGKTPVGIAKSALKYARKQFFDVVIVDTAGRMHVDEDMMSEIIKLHKAVTPVETLFVVDGMTGQDAANTAKAFNDALPLTGIVLTKMDGDARGGAALSVRHITGKPVKFLGLGEKTDALEVFHPDRIASRILGMGDVLTLIDEIEQKVDQKKTQKLAKKLKKGKGFDLQDYMEQLQQMQQMGGMKSLVDKLPGMGKVSQAAKNQLDDREISHMVAMVQSMTPHERTFPAVIKGSRKKRIAKGSGTTVQEINRMLKQFMQMQKMMKKMSKGGMKKMMRGMQGQLPPGMMPPL